MPTLIHKKQIIGQANNTATLVKDTVGWTCKNLLRVNATSQTLSGVTFTVNEDFSISCSGTAISSILFDIATLTDANLQGEDCTITGCPANGSSNTYSIKMRVEQSTPTVVDTGDGKRISYNRGSIFSIGISAGVNTTGLVFYPMLCKSSIKDTSYEPYHITVEEALDIIESGVSGEIVLYTMLTSQWNENVYSFEPEYPFADYDISIEPDGDRISKKQYEAWSAGQIVGSATTNSCIALGDVPTVDIPIILIVKGKS